MQVEMGGARKYSATHAQAQAQDVCFTQSSSCLCTGACTGAGSIITAVKTQLNPSHSG